MEELSSWRHPVNLPELLAGIDAELDAAIAKGRERDAGWSGHRDIAETILDAEPAETLAKMLGLVGDGVPLKELSASVAYAAARRPVHFHVSNEFGDWDTVHHTFTYTNGVDQAMRRAPSRLLARGIFDGAMSVYLERFLNVPKQPLPRPSGRAPSAADILRLFDIQGQVDETGQAVADMLAEGRHPRGHPDARPRAPAGGLGLPPVPDLRGGPAPVRALPGHRPRRPRPHRRRALPDGALAHRPRRRPDLRHRSPPSAR